MIIYQTNAHANQFLLNPKLFLNIPGTQLFYVSLARAEKLRSVTQFNLSASLLWVMTIITR